MNVAELRDLLSQYAPWAEVKIERARFDEASGGNIEFVDLPVGAATWEGNHVLLQA